LVVALGLTDGLFCDNHDVLTQNLNVIEIRLLRKVPFDGGQTNDNAAIASERWIPNADQIAGQNPL
jgi:hypothetical protein